MKNSKKIVKIAVISMLVMMMLISSTVVFAAPDPSSYTGNGTIQVEKIDTLGQNIIKIISTIGSIASVIVLIVLGIKYMMGSAEEKADYKKSMIPYIVGAVLVFASTAIVGVVYDMASSLNSGK